MSDSNRQPQFICLRCRHVSDAPGLCPIDRGPTVLNRDGELLAGRYRLSRPLVLGGSGVLWEAEQLSLGRPVAVRLVSAQDAGAAERVRRGASVMARMAHVQNVQIVPVHEIEPFTLNAAYQIRDFLARQDLRSVVVVAPAFRSRRASFVFGTVLKRAGVKVSCLPVFVGTHTVENWATSWHGIEVVGEQFIKLQFYRFYILHAATVTLPSART